MVKYWLSDWSNFLNERFLTIGHAPLIGSAFAKCCLLLTSELSTERTTSWAYSDTKLLAVPLERDADYVSSRWKIVSFWQL